MLQVGYRLIVVHTRMGYVHGDVYLSVRLYLQQVPAFGACGTVSAQMQELFIAGVLHTVQELVRAGKASQGIGSGLYFAFQAKGYFSLGNDLRFQ